MWECRRFQEKYRGTRAVAQTSCVGLPGLAGCPTWVLVSPEMVGFPAPIR